MAWLPILLPGRTPTHDISIENIIYHWGGISDSDIYRNTARRIGVRQNEQPVPQAPQTRWRHNEVFMKLQTENYSIREINSDDLTDDYFDWHADEGYQRGHNLLPASREAVIKFVDAFDGEHRRHLGIFANGLLIGYMNVIVRGHIASTAILIGNPAYHGIGAVT